MTSIRRALVLIGLTLAVMIGAAIPASATFADSVTVNTAITAGTVTAPATVTPTGTCTTTTSGYWNYATVPATWVTTYQYWYNATVTWSAASASTGVNGQQGVTGYVVMAHLNNGQSVVMAQTDAVNRTVSATVDRGYLAYQPTISVITLTSYGWTAESPRKAVPTC